jgi:hypothetical protein
MMIFRYVLLVFCLALSVVFTILMGRVYLENREDQIVEIVFCATCVLVATGFLSLLSRFFLNRMESMLACVFFGFLAGFMATNFVSNILAGCAYDSVWDYIMNYGSMVLLFGLSVTGIALVQITDMRKPRDK